MQNCHYIIIKEKIHEENKIIELSTYIKQILTELKRKTENHKIIGRDFSTQLSVLDTSFSQKSNMGTFS